MKKKSPPVEVVVTASVVRGAGQVARRLLRRTRSLATQASRALPSVPEADTPTREEFLTLATPRPAQEHAQVRPAPASESVEALQRELEGAILRAERAEHAAAWLRARLRAERRRRATATASPIDTRALAADLTRSLTQAHAHDVPTIRRLVETALTAHGLPVPRAARGSPDSDGAPLPGWPRSLQEAAAAVVLRRVPEVADPAYVQRALALVAGRGRTRLSDILRDSHLTSAMARRRLRLAVEALAALGALTLRDGFYTLNTSWSPPSAQRPSHEQAGQSRHGGPRRR